MVKVGGTNCACSNSGETPLERLKRPFLSLFAAWGPLANEEEEEEAGTCVLLIRGQGGNTPTLTSPQLW